MKIKNEALLRLIGLIKTVYDFFMRGTRHRIGAYAAQASFFIIISIVPFVMFLLSVSKFILYYFAAIDEVYLLEQVNSFIPASLAGYVEDMLYEVFRNSSGISYITAATALWLSSRGLMALYQGVCNVLDDGVQRSYVYARAVSVLYTLLMVIMLVLTVVVFGVGGKTITALLTKLNFLNAHILGLLKLKEVIYFVVLTLFFTSFYRVMPRSSAKFKDLLPGAVLAAAGWVIFSWGYSIYASHSSYASIYGSLTSLVLLSLWLYFCMNILLYGAEFNHALQTGFIELPWKKKS